ncbi:kinase-like domain protein [Rutstroemia sp. NJR-2017a WRK4]|nr:kinase-like domain protein [Rutstroemia sp. NJR-2017a WRK4]
MTELQSSMSQDEAISALLAFMFSGVIGSPKGKGVSYLVDIDRASRKIQPPIPIVLSKAELEEAVFSATGHHLKASSRFADGALSISYKVSIEEDSDIQYVVQLRHHGNVTSMNLLMSLISSAIDPSILPLPTVYPIPGEEQRQKTTGIGRQIMQLISGPMADSVYPRMSHEEKLVFVRHMALAFQATWRITLPKGCLIGELCATETDNGVVLSIGPDRHYKLGGPFTTVRDYLRAHICSSLDSFKRQEGIDEYKARFLQRVTDFVEGGMHNIPAIVEDIPVVAVHSDMGPHNVILSPTTPTDINAIIDWEFVASAPYASLHRIIEMLFRESAPNGFGAEYAHADELRDAFWGAIPEWRTWNESEATRVFLEWFRFALFMKAEWRPKDLDEEEKERYWEENVRVVEGLLGKYGSHGAS